MKLSMKNPSWVFLKKLAKEIQKQSSLASGVVLDIGCGEKPYLQYFNQCSKLYIGIDLPSSPLAQNGTVDIFADALNLPFKQGRFDTVLCFEVLDDIPEPGDLFREINLSLKQEGIVILSVPQMWNVHNAPFDFYRYTRYGLRHQAQKHGFEVIGIMGVGGFWARMSAKIFKFLFRFGVILPVQKMIKIMIIPLQPIFYLIDSVFFSRDDVICNLLVAKKVDNCSFKKCYNA